MYSISNYFPFLDKADFVKNVREVHAVEEFLGYEPLVVDFDSPTKDSSKKVFKAYRIMPSNTLFLAELPNTVFNIFSGTFGSEIIVDIMEFDYQAVANLIEVDLVNDIDRAIFQCNGAYLVEDILTDTFINACANGLDVSSETYSEYKVLEDSDKLDTVSMSEWLFSNEHIDESYIMESALDTLQLLKDRRKKGKSNDAEDIKGKDAVYTWLDAYFSLPEGEEMKSGGREVVPLLIGPTAVFKSATVKELCKKYNYRMVDFRVAFTSRLDYSGLFQIGEVEGKKYSYACPMEEIVVCSDGFREFCKQSYQKLEDILQKGYTESSVASDGNTVETEKKYLTDEQKTKIVELQLQYKNYMRTPVLFCDEITRCRDKGVNGILVQLLNQKKLNDMTLNGCKFVAATNLDIQKGVEREEYRMELDMLYDVNTDLDVAYSNRFIPLKVYPNDVMDRWFEWASGTTDKRGFKGVTNIHPVVLEFLNNNRDMVYTDKPVLDAIAEGLSDNEQRTQVFPNYRTWDMLSDYLYSVDKTAEAENDGKEDSGEEKLYKRKILEGYVSKWCCEKFIPFLESKGYSNYDDVKEPVKDDVGDFLSTALETGSPAMLIGPSALGKTSRVKQYMKKAKIKTGLEPVLINVNLASKDAVDLMGMPVKQSLTEYVGGGILKGSGLDDVSKELQSVVANVSADIKYGMTDIMTLRAPDKTIKDRFVTALKEGREVILFFDEVNRVSSNTVTSAVFEVISDYRFAGVDFSNYKDRVKVVAACNMAWEGMDDEAGGYGDTGTLDPAFAARFSIYWKKNYDENDVASWVEFMESQKEEGLIDGTLIEFFKGLDTEQALKIMASVEKRTLEDAQPSTRNMLQLSKDIKSMRGKRQENGTFKAKAFNGKILFTDDVVMQFEDLILERQSDSLESHAQKTIKFLDSLLYGSDNWESLLIGDSVKVGDTSISASDIVDSLAQCRDDLKQFTLKPMSADDRVECSDTIDLVEDLAGFVRQLDINTSNKREDMFKMYLGESILGEFTKYFNNTFGTNLDEDISIEQLSDKTLIIPFMKIVQRNFSKYSGNTESIVKYCLDLCNDFMEAHGKTLPNENYAMFLTGIKDILPNADNMVLFLKRSGENLEDMYQLAEGVGDDWIIDITSDFGNKVSREDIENIKKAIKESKKSKTPKNVKYNVL
jgi:MoxR-like ATPase|nr:MAG TPA: MCM P-loop domain [Caudoviricetes sp.]